MAIRTYPNVLVLIGDDDFQVAEAVGQHAPDDPSTGDLNRNRLDGSKLTPLQLREQVEVMPFLADIRVVVVSGLLSRFERDSRSKSRQAEISAFQEVVLATPPSTRLVLADRKVDLGKNPLASALRTAGIKITQFEPLRPPELRRWVQGRLDATGGKATPDAISRLIEIVGSNLWVLRSELEKLRSYAGDRTITVDDVDLLTSLARESSVYQVVDGLVAGNGRAILEALGRLLEAGESPFGLLALAQNRVRQLWVLSEVMAEGIPVSQARYRAGLGGLGDFMFERLLSTVQQIPPGRLRQVHQRLLELDRDLKTGRAEPRLGIELLALGIERASPR